MNFVMKDNNVLGATYGIIRNNNMVQAAISRMLCHSNAIDINFLTQFATAPWPASHVVCCALRSIIVHMYHALVIQLGYFVRVSAAARLRCPATYTMLTIVVSGHCIIGHISPAFEAVCIMQTAPNRPLCEGDIFARPCLHVYGRLTSVRA